MKKLLHSLVFLFLFINAKAQFVEIPDANFRTFLKSKYPACFNVTDQLDTICAANARDSNINCSKLSINSLAGIKYFKRLVYLNCDSNNLIALPTLPNSLRSLSCQYNNLTIIYSLPDKLSNFNCSHNKITSLPSFGKYTQFDQLIFSYNLLTDVPVLPKWGLVALSIDHNKITCLPPVMPTVVYFSIDSSVSCVTVDNYSKINWASVYGGPYGGILQGWGGSNTMPCYDCPPSVPKYPICDATNNVNGCILTTIKVEGIVYYDNNSNGIKDINEPVAPNIKLVLQKGGDYFYTNSNGSYKINIGKNFADTLVVTPTNYFTAFPESLPIASTNNDTLIKQDFALRSTQIIDSVQISIVSGSRARPGFNYPYYIRYWNTGTTTLFPNIIIPYDAAKLLFDSSSDHNVINSANTLNLSAGALAPGESKNFVAYFRVKTNAAIGDSIITVATIVDGNVSDTDVSKAAISGSFDPNDKQATSTLSPQEVTDGEYINYTIRFQNTGNDTAFNIVIADTLDSQLQKESFEIISTSHNCNTSLVGNVLYFEFLNVLLPDSNINEPASHGFVTFRIRAMKSVQINDVIPNKAHIYFDYNAPIVTNVAITTIYINPPVPVGLKNFSVKQTIGNQLHFTWLIENEINSSGYELEKSVDGTHFSKIGLVDAQGISNYNFTTAMPTEMITYYRLKMIDVNGKSSYSNVVKIQQQQTRVGLMVMNPVKNDLTINVADKNLINTQAIFVNNVGQVIKKVILKQGLQTINISNLSKGNYYLQTNQGNVRVMVL
ncbi:MAG: hypothetical protein V4556_06790 [Bacteroidota bacterium]